MNRVSAIVAVRNGVNYLRESLHSILGQTVAPSEVIVVDDGSTDGTPELVEEFQGRVVLLRQAPSGQAAAVQAGVDLATGDFLAFNDHDDLWAPRKLELQLAAFEGETTLEAVYGYAEQFVSPEITGEAAERLAPPVAMLPGEIGQCLLVRTSALHAYGGFSAADGGSWFLGWLGRAKRSQYRSLMLPDVVLRRRLHFTNYGRTSSAERDRTHLAALRRHIAESRR